MSKTNPLFIDSTKFRGDLIGTQIELRNVMVYEDEGLFVLITNNQGMTTRSQMKVLDYRSYEARVHLNHQTHVTFQFVVEKDGQVLWQSAPQTARAQYAIVEDWEPILGDGVVTESLVNKPVNTVDKKGVSWAQESTMNVRALMDKWGF